MQDDAQDGPLRVLVVEDEYLIALELEEMIERLGFRVIGPAPTVAKARSLLERERPNVALLDVNLGGERSTPIAELLRQQGIPFMLTTGYDRSQLSEPALADAPRLSKPVDPERLRHALARHDGARHPIGGGEG